MKKGLERTLTWRAVYILKRGFFLVIAMSAAGKLYFDKLAEAEGGGEWARGVLLPLGREMVENVVMTLAIVVISAIIMDLVEKSGS